jgi:TatD DNase family protein
MNSKLKYIDIHSHLNFPDLKNDLDNVFSRMRESQVGTISVGVDKKTSKEVTNLAQREEDVWACIGIHPEDSKDEFDEEFFEELLKSGEVVCIGECGLDYFRNQDEDEKVRQKELFKKQIDFALKYDLPLMLHVRPSHNSNDAHRDVLEILEAYKKIHGDKLRGNSHFFASGWKIAQKYFDLGFTISFTGLITFVRDFDKVIKNAPLGMFHIETDTPFVAPIPHKGERNEPSYVVEVIKKIAEIRGENEEEIRGKVLENSKRLFAL